jgi:uncharacterized protein (DUF2267 family)
MKLDEFIERVQHWVHLRSHGEVERVPRATLETPQKDLWGLAKDLVAQLPAEFDRLFEAKSRGHIPEAT